MAKAAIATLDLVFATIIVSLFLLSLSDISENKLPLTGTERMMRDILTIMSEKGCLQGMNQTAIQAELDQLLPEHLSADLEIICYSYCSDIMKDCSTRFYNNANVSIQTAPISIGKDIVSVQQFFVVNNSSMQYCIAKLGAWQR